MYENAEEYVHIIRTYTAYRPSSFPRNSRKRFDFSLIFCYNISVKKRKTINYFGAHYQVWEKEVIPMTNREFYTAIANGSVTEDVIAHATASLEKMDEANEKRKNKPSKTAEANAPILEALTNALTADYQVASDLASAVGISTQKASSLLRQLVANGTAVVTDIKVPKKGSCKGYALPSVDAE